MFALRYSGAALERQQKCKKLRYVFRPGICHMGRNFYCLERGAECGIAGYGVTGANAVSGFATFPTSLVRRGGNCQMCKNRKKSQKMENNTSKLWFLHPVLFITNGNTYDINKTV
jgi:hypothetical protein